MFPKIVKDNVTYIALLVVLLAMFFLVREPFRDDIYFRDSGVYNLETLTGFLAMRYENWSSRLISEAVIILLLKLGMAVWRIFTVVNILVVARSIKYLTGVGSSRWQNAVLCMMVAAFPVSYFASAGWVTTTSVYLLSAALGLIALFPIRKWIDGKKIAWWEAVLYLIAAVIACNQEQVCAVLLGVYLCSGIYGVFSKQKIHWIQICMLLICVLSVIFILTCPGNAARKIAETETWLPEFADWTLMEKLVRGFLHAADNFFYSIKFVSLTLVFVVTIMVIQKSESSWKKILSGFGALWLCAAVGIVLLQRIHIISEDAIFRWGESGENMLLSGGDIFRAISAVVLLLLLAAELYWLLGRSLDFLVVLMILGAGFGSAVIVSFSPTIYASGERIFTFCFYSVYLVIGYLLKKLYPDTAGKEEMPILSLVAMITVAAAAKNIMFLLPL